MILTCPFCNAKVRPGEQDCPVCKQRMTRACPSCAETVAANAAACKYCGEDFKRPGSAARAAAPTPGIVFIEDAKPAAPAKKRCCAGGKWLAALLLAGLVTCAFAIRTDCVVCSTFPEHETCITTKKSVSHCSRSICKKGKTQLWATVYERLGGHINSCQRKEGKKAPSPDACCPARK